jgi:hypothetical protein
MPTWVFDLAHHMHARYHLNMIQKKLYLIWRRHHLKCMEQEDVQKYLHLAPEMHAWGVQKSLHVAPEMHAWGVQKSLHVAPEMHADIV